MVQDPSLPAASVPTPPPAVSDPAVSGNATAANNTSSDLQALLTGNAPVIQSHDVQVEGDVEQVPQEPVGLGAAVPSDAGGAVTPPLSPPSSPASEPMNAAHPTPSLDPVSLPSVSDSPSVPTDSPAVPPQPTAAATASASGDDKSPLDILEEILAGAEAEKKVEDMEKQKKEQEEAEFQAQLAVKKADYQVEADAKLKASEQVVEEAKVYRDEIDQDLQKQGKLEENTSGPGDDFIIHQLDHKKPE